MALFEQGLLSPAGVAQFLLWFPLQDANSFLETLETLELVQHPVQAPRRVAGQGRQPNTQHTANAPPKSAFVPPHHRGRAASHVPDEWRQELEREQLTSTSNVSLPEEQVLPPDTMNDVLGLGRRSSRAAFPHRSMDTSSIVSNRHQRSYSASMNQQRIDASDQLLDLTVRTDMEPAEGPAGNSPGGAFTPEFTLHQPAGPWFYGAEGDASVRYDPKLPSGLDDSDTGPVLHWSLPHTTDIVSLVSSIQAISGQALRRYHQQLHHSQEEGSSEHKESRESTEHPGSRVRFPSALFPPSLSSGPSTHAHGRAGTERISHAPHTTSARHHRNRFWTEVGGVGAAGGPTNGATKAQVPGWAKLAETVAGTSVEFLTSASAKMSTASDLARGRSGTDVMGRVAPAHPSGLFLRVPKVTSEAGLSVRSPHPRMLHGLRSMSENLAGGSPGGGMNGDKSATWSGPNPTDSPFFARTPAATTPGSDGHFTVPSRALGEGGRPDQRETGETHALEGEDSERGEAKQEIEAQVTDLNSSGPRTPVLQTPPKARRSSSRTADKQKKGKRTIPRIPRVVSAEAGDIDSSPWVVDHFAIVSRGELDTSIDVQSTRGVSDLRFRGELMDRYPVDSRQGVIQPNWACLPDMVFPTGIRLTQRWEPPTVHFFQITNSDYQHFYGVAVIKLELITALELFSLFAASRPGARGRSDTGSSFGHGELPSSKLELPPWLSPMDLATGGIGTVFSPKAFILISRHPLFSTLRRAASQLLRLSLSSSPAPLERFVASLCAAVPLPPRGLLSVGFTLGDKHLLVARPPPNSLPLLDLPIFPLFHCLDMHNFLHVFTALVCETSIVFCSRHVHLLSMCIHSMLALLWPFEWPHAIIPVMPLNMAAALEVPVPLVVGFPAPAQDALRLCRNMQHFIVDLDQNRVYR